MRKALTILLALLLPVLAVAGTVKGVVSDSETKDPLAGVNVTVMGTTLGAATDQEGFFVIENVPEGDATLVFSYIGYAKLERVVNVGADVVVLDIALKPTVFAGQTILVEVNRAEERKTPIAFSTIEQDEILDKYATQDVPDLLRNIPGVFASTAGLGESEIFIRGFDAEHIQVLINGIPENDPESQKVYWSNWTGLSGNASSIQVQRGVGASLMGSGSFGGSVNIVTSQFSATPKLNIRGSMVSYNTTGGFKGMDRSADGLGGSQTSNPSNEIFAFDWTSGLMYDGKLNIYLRYERKSGDSYLNGTYYNGHSFYLGAQSILGDHLITFAAHGAPQRHNQARKMQDIDLIEKLGREYNRYNHPYQENYYFKPQFELHDDWTISDTQFLKTNAFFTFGTGGGRYLRNDSFDVNTGAVGFKSVSEGTDAKYFARNALNVYQRTGVVLTGFNPADSTLTYGSTVYKASKARDLISSTFAHSWRNDSQNHHKQFGINTAYQHQLNEMITFTVGGEARVWEADHYAQTFDFRKLDPTTGNVKTLDEVQRRYDYTGKVSNFSGFGRVLVSPIPELTLMLDGQYASYTSEVVENPIRVYDFVAEKWTNTTFYGTKNLKNSDGSLKYSASDYERTFSFFMPKFGANYNVNENLNVFANYSVSKKEPKVGDWYSRSSGPGANQQEGQELKEETLNNIELGLGYRTDNFTVNANFYSMDFEDKIESVTNQEGDRVTINAGNAKHQGVELAASGRMDAIDVQLSASVASNEWQDMNVQKIFGEDAADVKGKVVPFSPEKMYSAEVGYNIGGLRLALGAISWQDYYVNYTNTEKLPNYFSLNAAISYKFNFSGADIALRLNLNNLTNKDDNYESAAWTRDFNRNDSQAGQYQMYVLQSPLFHTMFTAQITL